MLIPVFTVYATQLSDATPTRIGLALGAYGLTQGLLQIPFGMLSDRFGRKPLITLGLVLFALGSLWGALTTSIGGMILARTLQGMGAIGSVLIALLADLTEDRQRTKAMAVIGMSIGVSFSLAMIISPAIALYTGLSGIFFLTMILALLGLLLLHLVIPNPSSAHHPVVRQGLFLQALANRHLQRLNIGIFCQHFILTATFFAIPFLLQEQMHLNHLSEQWHFYLPLMIFSFLLMIPCLLIAEKKHQVKSLFVGSTLITGLCQLTLAFTCSHWHALCGLLFTYFVVFNNLEALLPSLVSKQANPESKGTAMGIYSSSQFLGLFAGGVTAGIVYPFAGHQGIFIVNSLLALLSLVTAYYLQISVKTNP